jgi:hypothetical protein
VIALTTFCLIGESRLFYGNYVVTLAPFGLPWQFIAIVITSLGFVLFGFLKTQPNTRMSLIVLLGVALLLVPLGIGIFDLQTPDDGWTFYAPYSTDLSFFDNYPLLYALLLAPYSLFSVGFIHTRWQLRAEFKLLPSWKNTLITSGITLYFVLMVLPWIWLHYGTNWLFGT